MTTPRDLIKQAIRLGACDDIHRLFNLGELNDVTWGELVPAFYTPKVLEFCRDKTSPTMEMLSEIPEEAGTAFNLFIDRDGVSAGHRVLIAGESEVRVFCSKPEETYHIVVMHGAKAVIFACEYAVVEVTEIGEGTEVEFIKQDGTAVRL